MSRYQNTVYHVFAVRLAPYAAHETPRVEYADYYVQGASIPKAYATVRGFVEADDVPEVWLAPVAAPVIVSPGSRLCGTDDLERHERLFDTATKLHAPAGYRLMWQGPAALHTLVRLRSTEHVRERVERESDRAILMFNPESGCVWRA